MKVLHIFFALMFGAAASAQSITAKLKTALIKLEADSQLRHGFTGLYVINSKTGEVIISENAETGMVPASSQKVIISAAAFELLGKSFSYKTNLAITGKEDNGHLNGDIIITGNGDPTLGSWRFNSTKEDTVLSAFSNAIHAAGITSINKCYIKDELWNSEAIPNGWTWDDIGSYYGAGARAFNWRENQYDILLRSGKNIGDAVSLAGTIPEKIKGLNLVVKAATAEKGSGDNAYVFLPNGNDTTYIRGTIPVNENRFTISGSLQNPAEQFALMLQQKINCSYKAVDSQKNILVTPTIIYTHTSPVFDTMNFYFLRKSVNLYGEAFLKTMAYQETGIGATDSGARVVKKLWTQHGIEPTALNIIDGSGLSPANRVTPTALVKVMQFAKTREWYNSFYEALPEINGIKMKSGSIGGVASYTGYIKNKSGTDYTFAFIINNYNGSGMAVRKKMWAVLDILK